MILRPEKTGDEAAIHALTQRAFAPMPFSEGTEPAIIDRLRADGDLTISLVAEDAGQVVGHIAFSPVTINGAHGGWFGLGPIAVEPERQWTGIGKSLTKRGLDLLRERDATGCALIGNPAYYNRFGFRADGSLTYGDVPSAYVQWLAIKPVTPKGVLKYAPAFDPPG